MRNIFTTLAISAFHLFLNTNAYSQVNFNKVDSLINFLSSDSWVWISSKGVSGNDIYTPKEFLKNKILKFEPLAQNEEKEMLVTTIPTKQQRQNDD